MEKSILSLSLISLMAIFTGCEIKKVESRSLAEQANNYKKEHRIVFYNGADMNRRIIFYNDTNGEYILTITGRCSVEDNEKQVEVICKTGANSEKRHFLRLSDNVTYFAEQLDSYDENEYNYEVVYKPQTIKRVKNEKRHSR